ncbi:MAG TPA: diphthamide synthesis protein [Candidatus Nanoarchaeia archaeon]|nr:diphthamide synthesis protein [Candidatus Nanoarchaeia archaeon]
MKVLFLSTKSKINIKPLIKKVNIKGKIGLVSIIQYVDLLKELQAQLPNSVIIGQVVGCSLVNLSKEKVDSYLYLGVGKFHPIYVARKTKKPTYSLNPETEEFFLISNKEIEDYEKQKLGKIKKFLAAEKIGVIVSTKPGQENIALALDIKSKLKKECFIFTTNTLDLNELENFPQIQAWINTSCSRLEAPEILNYEEIPKEYIQAKSNVKSFRPNLIQDK